MHLFIIIHSHLLTRNCQSRVFHRITCQSDILRCRIVYQLISIDCNSLIMYAYTLSMHGYRCEQYIVHFRAFNKDTVYNELCLFELMIIVPKLLQTEGYRIVKLIVDLHL